jgi:hypothetical protein
VTAPPGLPVIGLHGAPRSGTTWIGEVFNAAPEVAYRFQPFFAYAFRARVDAARTPQDLDRILDAIAETDDDFVLRRRPDRLADPELAFEKRTPTRLAYKEARYHHLLPMLMKIPRFRGVGIVRSPFAVLESWLAAPKEFDPRWDFAAEWRGAPSKNGGRAEEFFGYEGWKRAMLIFLRMAGEHPERFRLLHYDRLVADPAGEIAPVFRWAGLELSPQVLDFLARSRGRDDGDPYGVFRSGVARAPSGAITPEIRAAIEADLRANGLEAFA